MTERMANAINRARGEILADMQSGVVPPDCRSFSELHDHVDANGYGGAFEEGVPEDEAERVAFFAFWNAVQDAVADWLVNRDRD
jgi:hypothetical protein